MDARLNLIATVSLRPNQKPGTDSSARRNQHGRI
jgi:hypothetical protein